MAAVFLGRDSGDLATRSGWLCAGLLGCALLVGGGGSPAPLPELALQIVAALIAALWIIRGENWRTVPRSAWLVALLLIAVPLAQLVPLPPAIWQALPGRALAVESLALVGRENEWQPWSLAPDRTLAALLALGPPIAVLIMACTLERRGRIALLGVVCGAALLTLLVGAMQLGGSSDSALRFYGRSDLVLLGFQANRNSTADLLLIALVAVPALVIELARRDRFPLSRSLVIATSLGGMALCIVGILLTSSRAGIALVAPALLAAGFIMRKWLGLSHRQLVAASFVLLAAMAVAAWLLWSNAAVTRFIARAEFSQELRPELWRDSAYAAWAAFPFGVGMGNFVPAILAGERLEVVRLTMPNRAHNDLLELAVEAGAFGLAAFSAIGLLIFAAARKALRHASSGGASIPLFALSALTLIAFHSLVDYPLRSMSLACLAAAAAGMLMHPGVDLRTGASASLETETI